MRLLTRLIVLVSVALSACAAPGGNVISSGDRFTPAPAISSDYRLGPGDKVKITVFNEETLSGEFAVSSEGMLSLPLVGDIVAGGKLASDVAKEDQNRLADGYLRNPKVSAEVSAFRPFFILGEVKLPGQYPFSPNMTVFGAIATAQGFTPRASRKLVYIRRSESQSEEVYNLTPDLRVSPGDTIRIGERYF